MTAAVVSSCSGGGCSFVVRPQRSRNDNTARPADVARAGRDTRAPRTHGRAATATTRWPVGSSPTAARFLLPLLPTRLRRVSLGLSWWHGRSSPAAEARVVVGCPSCGGAGAPRRAVTPRSTLRSSTSRRRRRARPRASTVCRPQRAAPTPSTPPRRSRRRRRRARRRSAAATTAPRPRARRSRWSSNRRPPRPRQARRPYSKRTTPPRPPRLAPRRRRALDVLAPRARSTRAARAEREARGGGGHGALTRRENPRARNELVLFRARARTVAHSHLRGGAGREWGLLCINCDAERRGRRNRVRGGMMREGATDSQRPGQGAGGAVHPTDEDTTGALP